MKKLVFFAAFLISLSPHAFAQQDEVFLKTSVKICNSDCSKTALEAEADATAAADLQCAPSGAQRLTNWDVIVRGFGRLRVTAAFYCRN
jgi:hypothetical protein